jgi:hypothetical protein
MNSIERLERRTLLDGDVTAFVADGDLFVRGDDDDNRVQIVQHQPGTIRVRGLEDTTVNGEEFVNFAVALNDVRVHTRQGGEDTVEIQGPLQLGGGVHARLGEGVLVIEGTLGPVEIAGDVTVRPGSGGDVQFRNEVIVHGRTVAKGGDVTAAATPGVIADFDAASFTNSLNIDNPYFPLVPGTVYTYEETETDDETGETEVTVVTDEVTGDTRTILGVEVRVVRAIGRVEGLVVEDTFDWFAQDDNGNVWYFGEDTTSFEYDDDGNVIDESDAGSFEAGMDGARAGVIMLARPQVGDAYFEEVFVGEAIDQALVLGTSETVADDDVLGTVTNALRTQNQQASEPVALEQKLYAPGFGLAREIKFDVVTGEQTGEAHLVSATRDGMPVTQLVAPDNPQGANATGDQVGPARFAHLDLTADGDIIVRKVRFEDDNAYMNSRNDLAVLDSEFAGEPVFLARGDAGLRNLTVAGETYIRGGEGVMIQDSVFQNDVYVRFFAGDNELEVGGSTFETLNANGGRGDNTFEDLGGNDFGNLLLKSFELDDDDDEDEDE